jgi:hypothetical protein
MSHSQHKEEPTAETVSFNIKQGGNSFVNNIQTGGGHIIQGNINAGGSIHISMELKYETESYRLHDDLTLARLWEF